MRKVEENDEGGRGEGVLYVYNIYTGGVYMPIPNHCAECDRPMGIDEVYICQNCFEEQLIDENHRNKEEEDASRRQDN